MHASFSDLFWTVHDVIVPGSRVEMTGFLGAGASAVVYYGVLGDTYCVVKREEGVSYYDILCAFLPSWTLLWRGCGNIA